MLIEPNSLFAYFRPSINLLHLGGLLIRAFNLGQNRSQIRSREPSSYNKLVKGRSRLYRSRLLQMKSSLKMQHLSSAKIFLKIHLCLAPNFCTAKLKFVDFAAMLIHTILRRILIFRALQNGAQTLRNIGFF